MKKNNKIISELIGVPVNPQNIVIHFDMDGTLAEWKNLIPEIKEELIKLGNSIESIEDLMKVPEIVKEMTEKIIRNPGYYYDLMPYQNVCDFVTELVEKGFEVRVNSCAPTDKAMSDKRFWLEDFVPAIKHTNKNPRYVIIPDGQGKNKADYIEDFSDINKIHILIDDHTPNLFGFNEKVKEHNANGFAIKMFNEINGKNGTWQGYSLSNDMDKNEMFKEFIEIIKEPVKEAFYDKQAEIEDEMER